MEFICRYCDKVFKSHHGAILHEKYCKENPNAVPYNNHHTAWNKGATALTDPRVAAGMKTRADNISSGKTKIIGHPQSEETRKLISKKRKDYLIAHPEAHVWKRNTKFISEPCEHLKKLLRDQGAEFIEEYAPFTDSAISLDIAFPNIKLGIEVNGNQHYNKDGTLADYYQTRHDKLTDAGWKIYEIHYSLCYSLKCIEDILKLDIYNSKYVRDLLIKKEQEDERKKRELEAEAAKKIEAANQKIIDIENKKQEILQSDIDFNKFGWVAKASKILNFSHTHTVRWMKKYLPEVYSVSFKRKSHTPMSFNG